jgi:tetratricopeptide (TPR) repeat protein
VDYITNLPEPGDVTIKMLRAIVAEEGPIDEFNLGLSHLEAPSGRLAWQLYQAESRRPARFNVEVAEIQQPDPRLPSGPADFVLWRYDGPDPQPALEPPASGVAQAVAVLAARPFHAADWADVGRKIANRLGASSVRDLLAVMTFPPPRQPPFTTWVWIQRSQVAAAFIIAGLDTAWPGSQRKRALFSLARGPMDWTVEAAIVALAQVVREQPRAARDVAALYLELMYALPSPGAVPHLRALLTCAARVPSPPKELALALGGMSKPGSRAFRTAAECYWRGKELTHRGKVDAALVEFSAAIQRMPCFAGAYQQRGQVHLDRADLPSALADLSEALRLDPTNAAAYSQRGTARDRQGDLTGALADLDQVIRLDPSDAGAYVNRGVVRGKGGDHDGALADLEEAIQRNPGLASAFLNRGVEYSRRGDYERAIVDYTEAIRLSPSSVLAYTNRAGARCEAGDTAGAIADCDAALQLDPRSAAAYGNRGYAWLKQGDYRRAVADSDQALKLRPHAYFYHNRARARAALGDRRRALADFQQTLRLMPDHPEAEEIKARIRALGS